MLTTVDMLCPSSRLRVDWSLGRKNPEVSSRWTDRTDNGVSRFLIESVDADDVQITPSVGPHIRSWLGSGLRDTASSMIQLDLLTAGSTCEPRSWNVADFRMTLSFVDFNGIVPEKFDAVELSHMVDAE